MSHKIKEPLNYQRLLLYLRKFVILEFQLISHVRSKREQSDGDFGDNAGIFVFDESIIPPDIDNGTDHGITSTEK